MKPERWQQVERLYNAALEREPAQRALFLAKACAGDPSLRAEVESLLAHEDQAGSFIEASAMEMVARELAAGSASSEISLPAIGKAISHYRILEKLGQGGMGEVFLANDLSLGRKVALKFLPDLFTGDAERMARFDREAKLLASLNHPNIAAIHGLEQAEGKRFLVLELVEGETLAQRLSKGSLPVEEALGVCRQIAEALEAAHEKGVIHRDLKPANVMITDGNKVKILDFGLAKALSDDMQGVDLSQSSTLTQAMTQPGVILGTAAYMSPEQAKGMAVDKRADIWAFGCVLYECLTGKRAFEGKTVTETLAAVLKNEPEWEALPATTPPNIRFVLRRCLDKVMGQRFHHAADLRIEIEEARNVGETAALVKHSWLAWIIAVLFLLTTAVLAPIAYEHLREKAPAAAEPMRFQITPPASLEPAAVFALSPDGRHLAFPTAGSDGVMRLWVRSLDSLEARPLPGTESPHIPPFFWSTDSRFITFDAGGKLKKVDIIGGLAQTICDLSGIAIGGSWNRDGVIIFGSYGNVGEGVKRVSAAGGTASPLAKPDPVRHVLDSQYPAFLPDGRHFLYLQQSDIPESYGVFIGSLDSRPEKLGVRQLLATTVGPVYIPSQKSGPGHILFMREQTLMAQQFDDKRLELVGDPVPVVEHVGSHGSYGFFSASTNGVLVYRSGGHEQYSRAMLFDRQGKGMGRAELPGVQLYGLALSPDGTQAAVSLYRAGQAVPSNDIWMLDFVRGTNMRFTFGQGNNRLPVWSPDGSQIIFASNRDGGDNLYQKAASGAKNEEPLLKSSYDKFATSWSSDGRFLLYTASDPKTKYDLWVLPMEGDRKPMPFLRTEFNESDGHFSPDMRWVAYVSDESGYNEIYVRRFSQDSGASLETGGKWVVSHGGGVAPRWRRNGKELYYLAPDGKVMVVEVAADTVFQSGTAKPLFSSPLNRLLSGAPLPLSWDVTSDGSRFLLPTAAAERTPLPFTVVLNWQAGLKK